MKLASQSQLHIQETQPFHVVVPAELHQALKSFAQAAADHTHLRWTMKEVVVLFLANQVKPVMDQWNEGNRQPLESLIQALQSEFARRSPQGDVE